MTLARIRREMCQQIRVTNTATPSLELVWLNLSSYISIASKEICFQLINYRGTSLEILFLLRYFPTLSFLHFLVRILVFRATYKFSTHKLLPSLNLSLRFFYFHIVKIRQILASISL